MRRRDGAAAGRGAVGGRRGPTHAAAGPARPRDGLAGVRAQRPRGGRRARRRPRVLLPLQHRLGGQSGRLHAHRPAGRVSDLTFSFVTCQKWDDGFYPAYREIAREDHDFVVHLGDYTYEYGIADNTGPRNPNLPPEFVTETETLERYRLQHALYKTDPHLQAAHRAHPFIVIWDDHEVQNDYTGDPFWFSRRANGYRAFYEHLPLRQESIPCGPDMPIYRKVTWGDLAEFSMLDTRQYRSNPPCGFGEAERCRRRSSPSTR